MKLCKLLALSIAAIAMVVVTDSDAEAQIGRRGFFPGAGIFGNFGGNGIYGYENQFDRRYPAHEIPYFSLHPPVYYNRIVPRPYGVSPYATPPMFRPVEFEVGAAEPTVIENPHFVPKDGKKTDAAPKLEKDKPKGKQTSADKNKHVIIHNPYYVGDVEPAELVNVVK